jgi:hypothetical protein
MRDYAPDPEAFRPEHFLEANVRDPSQCAFGFGRRYVTVSSKSPSSSNRLASSCPGRYLADNSLFISIGAMLQVFSVNRAVNENGLEKPLEPWWEDGLTTLVAPLFFYG